MAKVGRPKLPKSEKASCGITGYLAPDEWKAAIRLAAEEHRSVAAWLRSLVQAEMRRAEKARRAREAYADRS